LVLNSPWYLKNFPDTVISKDQNEKTKFVTTQRGFRFATSVGGSITGEGGNYLILDDPHNSLYVHSKLHRERVITWFEQSFSTRLDDKKKGVIIVVMQRLHSEDLTARLLEKHKHWEQLILPAIAPETKIFHFYNCDKKPIECLKDSILHEAQENQEDLKRAEEELGYYGYAAQYLQNPVPLAGGVIKARWFQYYDHDTFNSTDLSKIVCSWDTAVKAGISNDYSVCTVWGEKDNKYYLIEVLRKKLEYPELKKQIGIIADRYPVIHAVLIEDKASGQSLIQDLKKETKLPVIGVTVNHDKITRLISVSPLFESGAVLLPKYSSWLKSYTAELLEFPNGRHDDQVDSTSQYLNYIRDKKSSVIPSVRRL
jgi:predicted phage terminase large subunit-like protein